MSLNGVAISGMEKQPLTLSQLNSRWPLNALIGVEGRSIPVGTVVEVELLSEDGACSDRRDNTSRGNIRAFNRLGQYGFSGGTCPGLCTSELGFGENAETFTLIWDVDLVDVCRACVA